MKGNAGTGGGKPGRISVVSCPDPSVCVSIYIGDSDEVSSTTLHYTVGKTKIGRR